MSAPEPNPAHIREFFEKTIPDQMHLCAIDPEKVRHAVGQDFGTDVQAATDWALERNAEGFNVYFSVNRVRTGLGAERKKTDLIAVRFVHVDKDPPKGTAGWSEEEREAALDQILGAPVKPTTVVWSGNGYQALWRSDDSLSYEEAEDINKRLIQALGGDTGTHDLSRLLRVPGLINWPDKRKRDWGRVPVAARIIYEDDGCVCDLSQLQAALPPPVEQAQERAAVTLDDVQLLTADDLGLGADDFLRKIIEQPKGLDRSADTFALACEALRQGLTPQEVAGVLLNSENAISAHCLDQADPVRAARRAIERALGETVPKFEELLEAAIALGTDDRSDIASIVSKSAALEPVDRRVVLDAVKKATGIPLSVLKEQQAQGGGAVPDHLELARQVIALKGADNIICTNAHVWGWQRSGVWTVLDDRAVKQDVQAALDRVPRLDVYSATVTSVTEVLKNEIFVRNHDFNQGSPEAVNCLNGQVELQDGRWVLMPHRREDYRTTQIPVAFDQAATAPKFEVFLEQIFEGDPDKLEKRQALLELVGYTLMSHARHEKFAILIGAGANGKSVLLSLLYALAGPENVAGVQPSNFDNRFQRAHLHQKLANIVTELKQGEVIADAELKAITSGEPATVEHKHQDPFVMRPFATCWFGTNHMPHTRDFSEALFRRATILTFNRVFATNEQDPLLKEKLQTELPGILTLALNAYAAALERGFTAPHSSEAAKNEWRLEADQVAMFVDEACERDQSAQVAMAEIYQAYLDWARDSGIGRTLTKRSMRDRLSRLGFGSHRDVKARYVTGIRVAKYAPMAQFR